MAHACRRFANGSEVRFFAYVWDACALGAPLCLLSF